MSAMGQSHEPAGKNVSPQAHDILNAPIFREDYRHFQPPLVSVPEDKHEILHQAAHKTLDKYNNSSLARFNSPLRITKIEDPQNTGTKYSNRTGVYAIHRQGLVAKYPICLTLAHSGLELKTSLSVVTPEKAQSLFDW